MMVSNFAGLQLVVDATISNYDSIMADVTTGASLSATGTLVASQGKEQPFELQAKTIEIIGACDAEAYPLQKKQHSFEFLRTIAHLRPRTNTIGAVARFAMRLHMLLISFSKVADSCIL